MNILITGAGRGLGLALVRLHLAKGDRVYALCHSLTEELRKAVGDLHVFVVELTKEAEVKAVLSELAPESMDMIYNVAGIWCEDQMVGIEETDLPKTLAMYEVNAMGALCVMKYGKRLLKENAVLVNVSSEAGSIARSERKQEYGYCMSKAALNMATKIFQNETADRKIRAYCYHPGWLRTQMGGERAAESPYSISAEESADCLVRLLSDPEKLPGMFFDYQGNKWEW